MGQIKTKRNQVALNCSAIPDGVNPREYSALVIVELVPSLKDLKKDEDEAEYKRLLTILEAVRERAKKHAYSKNSLVEMVENGFLSDLSIDDLKDIIKDSKFCQFPDSLDSPMKFSGVSTNPPKLRDDYGEEKYVHVKAVKTSVRVAAKPRTSHEESSSDFDDSIKWDILKLARKLPEKEFVWQAMIDYGQYCEIKTLVERIFSKYRMSECSVPGLEKVLKFFIAEWYKREYHGDGRAISPSIPTDLSRRIVNDFRIDHVPVNVRTNWQSCIRALGGLPVFALLERLNSNRTNRFISNLALLFDPEDSQDFDTTEDLFNDKTINRSKSIRRLIPYLQSGRFPYDETDRINGESSWTFADFNEKLRTGFEENRRRKFSIEYRFWLMPGFAAKLTTCIRFKPNAAGGGRNFAINEDRLKAWGIDKEGLNQFTLCFECGGQRFTLPFFKCLEHDWIPYKCENVVVTDFPLFENIQVKLDQTSLPQIACPSRNRGCLQFYSDDHRSWTSRGSCGRYSLVVFDPSIWYAPESQIIEGYELEYVELVDGKCKLLHVGNGASISFYNAEGNLVVKPKNPFFQEGFFVNRIGSQFPCSIPGQEIAQNVYVLDQSGFDIGVIKSSGEISMLGDEECRQAVYDFKCSCFKEIENFDTLMGYQVLRFRSYDEKTAEVRCFFVPQGACITRNINGKCGSIELAGLSDFSISVDEGYGRINDRNKIACDYRFTKESSCCKLVVSDDRENQLRLEIVWPYDCADVVYKDSFEERLYMGSYVPAILADRYEYRRFYSEGLQLGKISDDNRYEINSFIQSAVLSDAMEQRPYTKLYGYMGISLYSRTIRGDKHYRYIVDCGNVITDDIDNLKFVFVPIDEGELVELPLKSIDNTRNQGSRKYLLLDIPDSLDNTNGIIIQSLKGLNPQEYYRAAYKPSANEPYSINANAKKQKRCANRNKYSKLFYSDKPDFKIAFRAFEIALDLECYFGWFDELKTLCSYEQSFGNRMVAFFKQYVDSRSVRHEDINYNGLWRLSGEFMFDWMLFPVRCWRALIEYKDYVRRLFLARPGLCGAARYQTEAIFSLIVGEQSFGFRRNNGSIENRIAQCIRGEDKDEFFLSVRDKVEIFKKMTDYGTLIEVYNVLNSKGQK